jgi:non-heme chloroperoxidase
MHVRRIMSALLPISPLLLALNISAQKPTPWHDPSPHQIQSVTVDKHVKLEVLNWGGSGRPVVLLAGLGNTAHVFDDFAPKLTSEYHVYGITRRGYGASSTPAPDAKNYSADRLGDDVLAVLDALKIDKAVLVAHSLGGEELTSVTDRHPERVAGLVYLDAGYAYAYYDSSRTGDSLKNQIDWNELKRKAELVLLENGKDRGKHIADLLHADLPTFEKDLQQFDEPQLNVSLGPAPEPTAADYKNFDAYRAYRKRTFGIDAPEAELREGRQPTSDGHVGQPKGGTGAGPAITAGMQKYTEIRAPVLAIFAGPHGARPYAQNDPALEKFYASDTAYMKQVTEGFQKGVPSARVVLLPHADHYVFLSNEADVLREMRPFLAGLK